MYYEVIPCKLFRQDCGILTYSAPDDPAITKKLKIGSIVRIPLGRQTVTGIVHQTVKSVDFPTKPIFSLLYDTPLPEHLVKSIKWLSDYYLAPLPQVAAMFLPTGIEKHRRGRVQGDNDDGHAGHVREKVDQIPLNPAQLRALQHLKTCQNTTKLLHGITGSGKTNIYLVLTKAALESGKSVILLVPEIALTSQLVQNFNQFTPEILHSRLTESERHQIWERILKNPAPQVIIGARSALFAPVRDLGLILIDEAHESAYYQENTPKYSAIRLASYMAHAANATAVLGSATPSVTDYYLAKNQNSYT